MPVELSHLGEDLIAAILSELATRCALGRVACAVTGRTLEDDIAAGGLGAAVKFRADDASLVVNAEGGRWACDGEQKVDVLCTGGSKRGIAFEAKLGETRMAKASFRKQFCAPCVRSRHADSRLSGSMVAVLDRSLPFAEPVELVASVGDDQWVLARHWWLVVRSRVLNNWIRAGGVPVSPGARVVAFDDIASLYGPQRSFDDLVRRVVGSEFARRWNIELVDV